MTLWKVFLFFQKHYLDYLNPIDMLFVSVAVYLVLQSFFFFLSKCEALTNLHYIRIRATISNPDNTGHVHITFHKALRSRYVWHFVQLFLIHSASVRIGFVIWGGLGDCIPVHHIQRHQTQKMSMAFCWAHLRTFASHPSQMHLAQTLFFRKAFPFYLIKAVAGQSFSSFL